MRVYVAGEDDIDRPTRKGIAVKLHRATLTRMPDMEFADDWPYSVRCCGGRCNHALGEAIPR